MATYKVIQDIEAEDKLLGPLTFRQFVYMGISGVCLYLSYFVASKGAAFLIIPIAPFGLIAAFFAFPWSKEQPTEVWALARIRFLFKPRKRIWDQSGIKELVTVTVPKRAEQIYTDGLSQTEVRSRLQALASTIDSRGWAIKNPVANPYMTPAFATTASSSDRLISMDNLPHDVPAGRQESYTDMLDPNNNVVAQQFENMLATSTKNHRAQIMASMQQPAAPPQSTANPQNSPAPDYWFLNQNTTTPQSNGSSTFDSQVVSPGTGVDPTPPAALSPEEERALVEELKAKEQTKGSSVYSHLPTILPLAEQEKRAKEMAAAQPTPAIPVAPVMPPADDSMASGNTGKPTTQAATPAVTDEPDADIINLSRNDDLNIETLARQAKKAHGDDEVVISLH